MGANNCWEREVVITELTKGKEFMLQLQKHFDPMKQDVCQYLAAEVLSSYDKVVAYATTLSGMMISKGKEIINSVKSCDRPSNSRKRKIVSRRREYVHARPGEEVPPEDGYSWRKYGRKNIKGAKCPRVYYRCSHNRSSNCVATKMVQQSETEPLAFEVSYGESHSCGQEKKNQNEQLLPVQQTKCDEVRREISESDNHEIVSTPNNPLNSDFIASPPSSPLPDTDNPLDNNSLTDLLFDHDVPENARSTNKSSGDNYISHNAEWNLSLDNFSTLFDDNCSYRGVRKNALGKWAAEICDPDCGTPIWLGTFENSHNAAVAYDAVAYKLYGENANFNFPHRYNKQAENNVGGLS